ncbi:GNAT family N-acetyltransferase [Prevotella intermedia]|uniref:GNAT family N-acetyltransferase n=1 Tax=Prevotella intermedia TaxID=28131 RepID=A0A2M8M6V0_PREIN|nr:GNAT family N-acetyltransferase [Prevotella intermedia]PJE99925.1 GNAT family N-acetyltransferase [Prevotella intermedia]
MLTKKSIFKIKKGNLTYEEVYRFVKEHSYDFHPCFEEQVGNLVLYINKVMSHASIYYVESNQIIVAMMFVYYNMDLSQIYVPYICVDCEVTGLGIGRKLIEELKKKKEFTVLRLEVSKDNTALTFYSKIGFTVEEERDDKFLMRYKIVQV